MEGRRQNYERNNGDFTIERSWAIYEYKNVHGGITKCGCENRIPYA
jgi:hypothetical protein